MQINELNKIDFIKKKETKKNRNFRRIMCKIWKAAKTKAFFSSKTFSVIIRFLLIINYNVTTC